jgi:hypothetical protein
MKWTHEILKFLISKGQKNHSYSNTKFKLLCLYTVVAWYASLNGRQQNFNGVVYGWAWWLRHARAILYSDRPGGMTIISGLPTIFACFYLSLRTKLSIFSSSGIYPPLFHWIWLRTDTQQNTFWWAKNLEHFITHTMQRKQREWPWLRMPEECEACLPYTAYDSSVTEWRHGNSLLVTWTQYLSTNNTCRDFKIETPTAIK